MTDFWVIYKIQRDGTKKFLYRRLPQRWVSDVFLALRFTEEEAAHLLGIYLQWGKEYQMEHYQI